METKELSASRSLSDSSIGRNQTLDIAKGLGIFFVVLGHNQYLSDEASELFRVVFSFHMPLFFLISGVFIQKSAGFRNFLLSKTDSLLKPYFVVMTLLWLTKLPTSASLVDGNSPALTKAVGVLWASGSTIDWIPMWFLPHLFLVVLATYTILNLLRSASSRWIYVIGAVIAGAAVIRLSHDSLQYQWLNLSVLGLPWSLDLLLTTSAFCVAGACLAKAIKAMDFDIRLFVCALVGFGCLHFFWDQTMNLNARTYGDVVVSTTQAALGIYLSLSIACLIKRWASLSPLLLSIGSASLFILIFHYLLQNRAFAFLVGIGGPNHTPEIGSLLVGLLAPLLLFRWVRRIHVLRVLLLPADKTSTGSAKKIGDGYTAA